MSRALSHPIIPASRPMSIVRRKPPSPEQKVAAMPLADPDVLPRIPDHVKRPETDHPVQPVAVSRKQIKKSAKRRVKAVQRRLRSRV